MFEFLVSIFNAILYYPLFNALVLVYNYMPGHDFGLAIIFLTLIIRIIMYPVSVRALHSQRTLQRLQPQLLEIQKKYKDDKEKQAKETLELYRKEKINPFSGLLLVIVQFPILIALYRVFWDGLKKSELVNLYKFVPNPEHINPMLFNYINLSNPSILFAVLAGILQFFQTKMLLPKQKPSQGKQDDIAMIMQRQMVYIFPFITIIILYKLPSALSLYWIVSGVFSILQQYLILRKLPE
jgi:YidC/Oxa1 family membrane protein insertase